MSNKRLKGKPLMIVMSSPSGGGKSTLCRRLLGEYEDIEYSISCTTRAPRGQEQDGRDYYFMDRDQFMKSVNAGEFIEYAEVHGNYYGTRAGNVESALKKGMSLVLDIDVQGALQIRQAASTGGGLISRSFVDVFIAPPSLADLKCRLERRGEDSEESILVRLQNAEAEIRCASAYMYVIKNDFIDRAYTELTDLLEKESIK